MIFIMHQQMESEIEFFRTTLSEAIDICIDSSLFAENIVRAILPRVLKNKNEQSIMFVATFSCGGCRNGNYDTYNRIMLENFDLISDNQNIWSHVNMNIFPMAIILGEKISNDIYIFTTDLLQNYYIEKHLDILIRDHPEHFGIDSNGLPFITI